MSVVPRHDGRAAPINIVWRRFRPELIEPRRTARNASLARRGPIRYVQCQAAGFVGAFLCLSQHEGAVMRLERSLVDREFTQLVILYVDADGLQAKSSGVTRFERLKHDQRSSRLPGRGALEMRIARHFAES